MKEGKALLWLISTSAALLIIHTSISSAFALFVMLSYALVVALSALEILSLRVRHSVSSGSYLPYFVLGMSLLKMIISIIWIFYALQVKLINTQSIMFHFFIPYFVILALTAVLMLKVLR